MGTPKIGRTRKARLYQIVAFDNSDGNFTGNPSVMACNLPRNTARNMLESYRQIPSCKGKYRYFMQRQP